MDESDINIVLFEPEIPANTGNIIRLCANTGAVLHLIHPLGFDLEDKKLRRAGLDYHEYARVQEYRCLSDYIETIGPGRIFALSTRGNQPYGEVQYKRGDTFLFGPETRGLPFDRFKDLILESCLFVPMIQNSRSLNLSNTVAVVLFEAWRQLGFRGAVVQ